jgi:hypothetical protein
MATEKTRLYRNIGVSTALIGIPIVFFLTAKVGHFGLNLGATGLAVKMVILQFIAVNIQLWFNSRLLRIPFYRYFFHQIGVLLIFISVALGVNSLGGLVFKDHIIKFITSGVVYTLISVVLVFYFPLIMGLKRQDIFYFISKLKGLNFFILPSR